MLDGNSQFDWTFDDAGQHTVTFIADVDNHVAEVDEENNRVDLTIMLGGAPSESHAPTPRRCDGVGPAWSARTTRRAPLTLC
jgi:subtilase family serine protease